MAKYIIKEGANVRISTDKESIVLKKATQTQLQKLYNAGFTQYITKTELKEKGND